jgi:mono/diheme cytochrome c family protein
MKFTRTTYVYLALLGAILLVIALIAVRLFDGSRMPSATSHPGGQPGRVLMGQFGCLSCHALQGQGGNMAPELGAELAARGAPWIHRYLTSGENLDVYPGNGHAMFSDITAGQAEQLTDYLSSLSVSSVYQGPPQAPR